MIGLPPLNTIQRRKLITLRRKTIPFSWKVPKDNPWKTRTDLKYFEFTEVAVFYRGGRIHGYDLKPIGNCLAKDLPRNRPMKRKRKCLE